MNEIEENVETVVFCGLSESAYKNYMASNVLPISESTYASMPHILAQVFEGYEIPNDLHENLMTDLFPVWGDRGVNASFFYDDAEAFGEYVVEARINGDEWEDYVRAKKAEGLRGDISELWESWSFGLRLSYQVRKKDNSVFEDIINNSIVYTPEQIELMEKYFADYDNNFFVIPMIRETMILECLHCKFNTLVDEHTYIDFISLKWNLSALFDNLISCKKRKIEIIMHMQQDAKLNRA